MSNDQAMQENQNQNQNQPQPEPSSSSNSVKCEPNELEQETFDIWNHFTRKRKIKGKWVVSCDYCGDEYIDDGDNFEESLDWHLGDHPEIFRRDVGEEIGSGGYFFDEEGARKALALMIICHGYPISIVDHEGFWRFSNTLQPLFKMDRRAVKKEILKLYNEKKSETMELLSKIKSRVAITADMWSCKDKDKHYMAIKAHFIDDSMARQSRMFVYVPSPHTEDALSDVIVQCLKDWNLDTKLSTLTVDSCGTSDAIFECVMNKVSSKSLILGGQLFRMRCCNHILNLIVKDGLSIISDTVEKVRECVEFWTAEPDREETFEETCNQLNIPYGKDLVLDCGTRWVSTFLMINAAIRYKEIFHHLTQQPQNMSLLSEDEWNIQQNMSLPSEDEWNIAKEICQKLEMFYDLAELFFGTVSPTPNVYFFKVCTVRSALKKWLSCSDAIIQQMASSMIAKFDNYWSGINEMMAVGAVLDPRYKIVLLEFFFPRIYGENACHEIEKVKTVCQDLFMEYKNKSEEIETSSSSGSKIVTNTSSVGEIDKWEDRMFVKYLAERTASQNTKSELEQYLDAEVRARSLFKDLDILTWWKANESRYPTLLSIARDLLAIPTSTVVSESTFGTSGRFLTSHRSDLHRNYVEALMCTQDWLGFSGMDFENDIDIDFE